MRVLALDTAGPVVGVALLCGDDVRVRTAREARGTDALLLPWAEALAAEAGTTLAALDGVGVVAGPGAFTGLRVGLATAAGLAQALGVRLWTTTSLQPRALRVRGELPVLALLDARKGRVYASLHDVGGGVLRGPEDVAPEVAAGWATGPFVATGEGALVARAAIERVGGRVAERADDPAVDVLARLAGAALARGEGGAATDVAPLYVRAPDAKPPRTGLR